MSHNHRSRGLNLKTAVVAGIGLSILTLALLRVRTRQLVRRTTAKYPPQGDFVTAAGLRIHALDQGTGVPVVLIHGDGGSTYDFTFSIFDRMQRQYRTIVIDRPGLGYSERPARGYDPFVQARYLHAAVDSLGAERPVLVGHSRGGTVALAYAISYPEDVRGVVDLAGQVYPEETAVSLPFRILSLPVVGPTLAHTLFPPLGRSGVRTGLGMAFLPEGDPPPDYLDAYASLDLRPGQLIAHAGDMVYADQFAAVMADAYSDLDVPVAVVHGSADRNVDVAQSQQLASELPNAHLRVVEGAGHEVMFWHPEAVMDAVAWVVAQVDPH